MGIGNTNFSTFGKNNDGASSSSNIPNSSTTNPITKIVNKVKDNLSPGKGFNQNSTYTGDPGTFKKGGKVKKTGTAKVHKGERVLTKKQNRKYEARKKA